MQFLHNSMCLLFLLVLSALRLAFSDDDVAAVLDVEGRVGGSVWLRCNVSGSNTVKGVYFQKTQHDNKFVNGFYTRPTPIEPEYLNRTRFINKENKQFSLNMWNLTVSDKGEYCCIVMAGPTVYTAAKFKLTLTAPFSVPTVTTESRIEGGDGTESWMLRCGSSGGYPPDDLIWTVTGEEDSVQLQEGVSESSSDKYSGVWTISQTATFNCTHPANITCSVGGTTSRPHSICRVTGPASPPEYTVIIAVVLVFIFILVVVIILIRVCRRQQRPEQVQLDTVETDQLNHSPLLDQAG